MKKALCSFFVFILTVQVNNIAQSLNNSEIILNYDFGKAIHKVLVEDEKHNTPKSGHLILRDVTIGYNEMIYVSDAHLKKIIIFTKDGEFDSEINLTKDVPNTNFNRIKLSITEDNSLYVLLLWGEFYSKLVKYTNGEIVREFKLEKPFPGGRNIKITVSDSNIYIQTFPSAIDPRYFQKGMVFVYNHFGQFLGRTDFFLEDKKGLIYKKRGRYHITIYSTQNNIMMTKDLRKKDEISISHKLRGKIPAQDRWYIVGLDEKNNFYLSNDYKILKYNVYTNIKEEIDFDINTIKDKDVFIQNSSKIRVDYSGKLYLLATKSKLKDRSDSKAVILRIN